jgi:CHAT domain-containing protein
MVNRLQLLTIFTCAVLIEGALACSLPGQVQGRNSKTSTVPAELSPTDTDIRLLLGVDDTSCKTANAEQRIQSLQKALQIATTRGLTGDKAVVEAVLASTVLAQGKTEEGFLLFEKALQDSIEAKKPILEADILISLASESLVRGNIHGAIDVTNRALTLSEKSGNLYGKARALGELGYLHLRKGQTTEAASLLDQALEIDKLNGYPQARSLYYRGVAFGLAEQIDKALTLLTEAREKAVAERDVLTFVNAESSLAFGLTRKGKADEATKQMDLLKRNDLEQFIPDPELRACFSSSLQIPMLRLIWLEGLANVLEAANEKEKEIPVWQEELATSQALGFVLGQAEAKEKIADAEAQLKRTEDAIKDYIAAADLYKKVGDESKINQVQVSAATLMVNARKGEEAIPLVQEIATYAKKRNLRELEFKAYITLSGIYQSAGRTEEARAVLEDAISLVRPGPFDEKLDNKTVHLAYVALADIYRKLQMPQKELVSIDQAFYVSLYLKDEAAQHREVTYLDQRLNDLHIRDLVEQDQKAGRLSESLLYSYILYLRDGSTDNLAQNPNWQRISNLPFQITQIHGGASDLEGILEDLDPILDLEPTLKLEKLSMLDALGEYYVEAGDEPKKAEKYAIEAENLLDGLKGDQSILRIKPRCVLALSYAQQGKKDIATKASEECLKFASATHEDQTILYAERVKILVAAQTGNIAQAKSSLQKFISKDPGNLALLTELVMSLANAKLYDEADHQLESVVATMLASGNKTDAALTYARVSILLDSDDSDTAKMRELEYLLRASRLYREIGDKLKDAETSIALGNYFLRVARNKDAIDEYERARQIGERANQKAVVAYSSIGLGNVYQALGDNRMACQFHERAANTFRELKNGLGEADSLSRLGWDYYRLNDPERAQIAFVRARKVAESVGPLASYFAAYFLGNFYASQADIDKAIAAYRDATVITTNANDYDHCAYSHLALAQAESFVGAWEDSLTETKTALSLFEKTGNKEGQSSCWAHLTNIYSDRTSSLKDFDKALASYQKAIDLGATRTLEIDLLEIYLQTGRYDEAARIAKDGVQACLQEKDSACEAHALISLSEAERLRGNLKESRDTLKRASPIVANSADVYLRGRLQYQGSRLLVSEGKFDEALASYEQLITLIEGIKGKLGQQGQKSLSENYGFIYDELVSLLYTMSHNQPERRTSFASEALEYGEKNKARQFSQSWGRVFKNQMSLALPVAMREREQSLSSQRDHLLTQLEEASASSAVPDKRKTRDLDSQLLHVQNQIDLFLKDLRRTAPQYAAIAYPQTVQISTLPLRQEETLVEFKVTEDATFVWIIQNNDATGSQLRLFYKVPQKRSWLNERVSTVRNVLNSPYPDRVDLKVCEQLFGELFPGEAAEIILQAQALIFIPDDVLFVLPFELYSPGASKGEYPLMRKATTYYPSSVSFELARSAKLPTDWQESFLGIADPITSAQDERFVQMQAVPAGKSAPKDSSSATSAYGEIPNEDRLKSRGYSFDPLPGTAKEVRSIAALIRERKETADVRVGIDATKRKLFDTDLAQFRFLHFATHGVLAVDTGISEPSLVLSVDGQDPSHMFLSMSEILGLKLQSESVVLSACNTGSGVISRAEGVMSIGRAFLAAGATSVTVSLWQVSDDSTALFMKKYYEGLLANKKKSVALEEARFAVFVSGSRNPFYWAPFIVVGE